MITSLNTLYCGDEPEQHWAYWFYYSSPSDIDVVWAKALHQDFRVCQNVEQSTLECMHTEQ